MNRIIEFKCRYCDTETQINVPHGHFIILTPGVSCEMVKERPGLTNTYITDVCCFYCGCQSGLSFKK